MHRRIIAQRVRLIPLFLCILFSRINARNIFCTLDSTRFLQLIWSIIHMWPNLNTSECISRFSDKQRHIKYCKEFHACDILCITDTFHNRAKSQATVTRGYVILYHNFLPRQKFIPRVPRAHMETAFPTTFHANLHMHIRVQDKA